MEEWGQDIMKCAYYPSEYMNDHIFELEYQCSALLTELIKQGSWLLCEFVRNSRM